MKKLILSIMFLLLATAAYCCSCIMPVSVQEEFKKSDVVFTGKVLSRKQIKVKTKGDADSPVFEIPLVEYIIQVNQVYKGRSGPKTLKIITGTGGGDCGFNFETGKEYIIYSSYSNIYASNTGRRFLGTDICRRTKLAESGEINTLCQLSKRCKK